MIRYECNQSKRPPRAHQIHRKFKKTDIICGYGWFADNQQLCSDTLRLQILNRWRALCSALYWSFSQLFKGGITQKSCATSHMLWTCSSRNSLKLVKDLERMSTRNNVNQLRGLWKTQPTAFKQKDLHYMFILSCFKLLMVCMWHVSFVTELLFW